MVEETFVAVADLLDVEGLIAETLCDSRSACLDFDGQQRVEDGEHRPVVDRDRPTERLGDILGRSEILATDDYVVWHAAAFEEWEAAGVEEASAVCGEGEAVVVDAPVHGTEGSEQAVPSR